MITPDIKGLLFKRAIKQSGKIYPCGDTAFEDSFTEVKGDVYFFYNDSTGSTLSVVYETETKCEK